MGRQHRRHGRGRRIEDRRKKLTDALRWHLAWGEQIEWLEKWAKETGEVPEAITSKPHLNAHLDFYWAAYAQLRTDRQIGLDRGPVMFSSINAYADRYGICDIDVFDRFVALIRAMDNSERDFKPGTDG